MIKIVSVFNALRLEERKQKKRGKSNDRTGGKRRRDMRDVRKVIKRQVRDDTSKEDRWNIMNEDIPFAVRYIKLVVECFESYHSHFDELARRIDRREDFAFRRR